MSVRPVLRGQCDAMVVIRVDDTGETMTLAEWFAVHLPRKNQEEKRIAIRFAMDAQVETKVGVISRIG